MPERSGKLIEILLVEDNAGDVRLMQEALKKCAMPHRLRVAQDIAAALNIVRGTGASRQSAPDLIILDLITAQAGWN